MNYHIDNILEMGGDKNSPILLDDIKQNIKTILEMHFEKRIKQELLTYSNRLSFACPYCGDSEKNNKLKRGNLYFENLTFHCFNCGIHKHLSDIYKEFNNILNLTDVELFNLKMQEKTFWENNLNKFNENSNLLSDEILPYLVDKSEIRNVFGFTDVKHTLGEEYLLRRMQKDFTKFDYSKKDSAIIIYNQSKDEKVLGFQKRFLKSRGARYQSYKLTSIYNEMGKKVDSTCEDLDKLSLYFGMLTLNLNSTITIFEGPFDSFLFRNSLATSGVHKQLLFDFDNKRYWLDNDEEGRRISLKKLEEGESIFLWKKFFNDYQINKEIKDLNDLILYMSKNRIKLKYNEIDNYFSKTKLDIMFL